MNIFHKVVRIAKKRRFVTAIVVVLFVFGAWYFVFGKSGQSKTPLISVTRGAVIQAVTVTGTTKPIQKVDLAFEKGGRVVALPVDVGTKVFAGQVLAHLDASELNAQLLQAQASVDAQKAKLDELKRGTREEDIRVQETVLQKARQDLAGSYVGVSDVLNDAYTKAEDAVRKQTTGIFSNEESTPQFTINTTDSQAKVDAEAGRSRAGVELNQWKVDIAKMGSMPAQATLDASLDVAQGHLIAIRSFLNRLMDALVAAVPVSPTAVSTYKPNVTTALTNVNTVLAAVSDRKQLILSQKIAVQQASDELALKRAGTLPETLRAQEAQVAQAQANVALIEAQIAKTVLRAPLSGVVTRQDIKLGEIVAPNTSVISIIFEDQLQIEANVPEVDIGKIKVDNPVAITLDALSGESFSGKVVKIDPAESIVDGVVNYKITIVFQKSDPRFKSGLTANLSIETLKKENVLILPQYAIVENDKGTFVRKPKDDGGYDEIAVVIGVRGHDGSVEIVSGLSEGDKVLNIGLKTGA